MCKKFFKGFVFLGELIFLSAATQKIISFNMLPATAKTQFTALIQMTRFISPKSGNDFIVKVGSGSVILKNVLSDSYNKIAIKNSSGKVSVYNDWKTMKGTSGADSFTNYVEEVTISGGNGNDTIYNYAEEVSIVGGADKDDIYNIGDDSTINGGNGNDKINNSGDDVIMTGDAGEDSLHAFSGENVTIDGGKGDDYIMIREFAENNVVKYASGDGNDTIYGFNSDDKIKITKGTYSVSTSGDDVIITVGKGSMTLKGGVGQRISIIDSKGKNTTKTYGTVEFSDTSYDTAELFAEDNFAATDNLSSIIENNLTAVSEIQTQKLDTLSQENLIAYAK